MRQARALGEQLAPHFARQLALAPGPAVKTTLDVRTQRFARDTLRRHLASLAARNVEDGAVVVLDNRTGEVRAWVALGSGRGDPVAILDAGGGGALGAVYAGEQRAFLLLAGKRTAEAIPALRAQFALAAGRQVRLRLAAAATRRSRG